MTTSTSLRAARALLLGMTSLLGLASIIATGSASVEEPVDIPQSAAAITASTALVTVAQGSVAMLRVDVDGLPAGQGVSGYAIDLSEVTTRIDIQTSACPSGVGTLSCRDWRIEPAADAAPGTYTMDITTVGTLVAVQHVEVRILVVSRHPPSSPARVVASRLVVGADGSLWSRGGNTLGQAGVGVWNACTDLANYRCLQPQSVFGHARVGTAGDWTDVVSTEAVSLGVRTDGASDGSVWIWGHDRENLFGSVSGGGAMLVPRQVDGLPDGIRRVSAGWMTHPSGQSDFDNVAFLALTAAGNVYAFGGFRTVAVVDGVEQVVAYPIRVPIAVTVDCVETPLDDVIDIAGGTMNAGLGMALALRRDGTVWYWGRQRYLRIESINQLDDDCVAMSQGMPQPVNGLPSPAVSIAAGVQIISQVAGRNVFDTYALAATSDGQVFMWPRPRELATPTPPVPQPVAGLARIREVSAGDDGFAAALDADGTVWRWRPGETAPAPIASLPPIARLGRATADFAIAADCGGSEGSLWSLRDATRVPMFGVTCDSPTQYRLTINRSGEGTVLTQPFLLECGAMCTASVPAGVDLRLLAQPAPGWRRAEHQQCQGRDIQFGAPLRLDADTQCDIVFEAVPMPKTLALTLNGDGSVVSDPAGIDCPDDCTETFSVESAPTARLTLTATSSPGWRFAGFAGDSVCGTTNFDMSKSRQCAAQFVPHPVAASPTGFTATASESAVALAWAGVTDGTVTGYRLERAEGTGASREIASGLGMSVTSYQDSGVIPGRTYTYRLFALNVSGASSPAIAAAAVGLPATVTLTVTVTGSGTVTSAPAGIACGADCSEAFALNTQVTLTAVPASDLRFDGWSGDCAGTAPSVVVPMIANRACTARFSAVSAGGWQTLVTDLATSLDAHVRPTVVLDTTGQAFVAYRLRVGTQDRITVRREGTGVYVPLGGALNANATWSATDAAMLLDANGVPVLAFTVDGRENYVVRWDGTQWPILSPQPFSLTANDAYRVRMVRSGNSLIVAWIEGFRIAVRRYNFATQQWEGGSFTPDPDGSAAISGPRDIDLAVDSGGFAVIAYTVGATGAVLRAAREATPGNWVRLGGDIGVRPGTAPAVQEIGLHVDTHDVVRVAWVEGTTNWFLQLAQFDGVNWVPLPGRTETRFVQSSLPVRALSVNRNRALFAFAYALDRASPDPTQSDVVVQQFVGNALVPVGTAFATQHPQVGALALAMNEPDRATLLQSQYTAPGGSARYTLVVRRHTP